MKEKSQKIRPLTTIRNVFDDVFFVVILIPLVFIALSVVYQAIKYPDKIPSIFGYKLFIIFDTYMDDSLEYGDLAITKNVYTKDLKNGDIIAFRNGENLVTIHKINEINQIVETDRKTDEKNVINIFKMNALENESEDTVNVREEKVEGLLVYKIPKLGMIIYIIQRPMTLLCIAIMIIIIGTIAYMIANKLDVDEEKKVNGEPSNT